ncbi:hypothetical protein ACPV5R_18125 [Vibrio astriarenae]
MIIIKRDTSKYMKCLLAVFAMSCLTLCSKLAFASYEKVELIGKPDARGNIALEPTPGSFRYQALSERQSAANSEAFAAAWFGPAIRDIANDTSNYSDLGLYKLDNSIRNSYESYYPGLTSGGLYWPAVFVKNNNEQIELVNEHGDKIYVRLTNSFTINSEIAAGSLFAFPNCFFVQQSAMYRGSLPYTRHRYATTSSGTAPSTDTCYFRDGKIDQMRYDRPEGPQLWLSDYWVTANGNVPLNVTAAGTYKATYYVETGSDYGSNNRHISVMARGTAANHSPIQGFEISVEVTIDDRSSITFPSTKMRLVDENNDWIKYQRAPDFLRGSLPFYYSSNNKKKRWHITCQYLTSDGRCGIYSSTSSKTVPVDINIKLPNSYRVLEHVYGTSGVIDIISSKEVEISRISASGVELFTGLAPSNSEFYRGRGLLSLSTGVGVSADIYNNNGGEDFVGKLTIDLEEVVP